MTKMPKKAIAVRLNREARALLQRKGMSAKIEVAADGSMAMVVGGKSFSMNVIPEDAIVHHIYKDSAQGNGKVDLVGIVKQRAGMREVLSQEDRERYRAWMQEEEREKQSRRIEYLEEIPRTTNVRQRLLSPAHRLSPKPKAASPLTTTCLSPLRSATTTKSPLRSVTTAKSPLRSATTAKSPLRPATTTSTTTNNNSPLATTRSANTKSPLRPGTTTKSPLGPRVLQTSSPEDSRTKPSTPLAAARSSPSTSKLSPNSGLATLRPRLIHLLALGPFTLDQLTRMLKEREQDVMPILQEVGVLSLKKTWSLRLEVYSELQIHEWSRYDERERHTVLAKAKEAYDALGLPMNAPERANLYPPRPPPSLRRMSSTGHDAQPSSSPKRYILEKMPFSPRRKGIDASEKGHQQKKQRNALVLPSPASFSSRMSQPARSPLAATNNNNNKRPLTSDSSEDFTSDDDRPSFVAPVIKSALQLEQACKEHDEAQKEYVRLKREINARDPKFVHALEMTDDGSRKGDSSVMQKFYYRVKRRYRNMGGDMNNFRQAVEQCRQFVWQARKCNALWESIVKAHKNPPWEPCNNNNKKRKLK